MEWLGLVFRILKIIRVLLDPEVVGLLEKVVALHEQGHPLIDEVKKT